jgi:peptide/nickel transport system substrate-binding protein
MTGSAMDDNDIATRLGRRALIGGVTALGFSAGRPVARAATAETPRRGGVLRLAFASTPDSLDPQATVAASGNQISALIFDNLTTLDRRGKPLPMLATAWRQEKAALEWVFELRQGVRFHHGREFTAADVVATIERAYDSGSALRSNGAFGPVASVHAEGPHAVRLILRQPLIEVPVVVAGRWARIIPADRIATLKTEPMGTGPFLYKSFETGSSVSLERNPNYWMPDGRPYLDGMRLVGIKDSVAQQAALRGGSVDAITQIPIETYLGLRGAGGITTYSEPTGQYQCLMTQANLPPFDNPKVRAACRYIMDRRLLQASALLGAGTIGNDMPVPPDSPYALKLPQHNQDFAKARALLNEAGVQRLQLDLYTSSERPPTPKMSLAFKEGGAKVGIDVTIHDIPFTEYVASVSRKKPLYTVQWSAYPTLYETVYLMYRSGANWNYGGSESAPGLDVALDTMISEVDDAKRKQATERALRLIYETGDRIIPYFPNYVGATSTKVRNWVPPKYDVIDLRDVWLAA